MKFKRILKGHKTEDMKKILFLEFVLILKNKNIKKILKNINREEMKSVKI